MAEREVRVPDIGDFQDVPVIEVLVGPGDEVRVEQPLITLESDKAAMDVPSPEAGTVRELRVKAGDRISQGTPILVLEAAGAGPQVEREEPAPERPQARAPEEARREERREEGSGPAPGAALARSAQPAPPGKAPPVAAAAEPIVEAAYETIHASPAVRRFARELGVDITQVTGTGRKGRILDGDVKAYVRARLSGEPAPAAGAGIEPIPAQDHGRFGPTELKRLSRTRRVSGARLRRAWLNVPMVTLHEEADVTATEAYRHALAEEHRRGRIRVTMLGVVLQATAVALKAHPELNASLDAGGEHLILKRYCHIGVAVDTDEGLVVPVLRDADQMGLLALCRELGDLAARARGKTLQGGEMQGASFTVTSLGGIGGTGFTPIVNAPEVAILGVARARVRAVWTGDAFQPRLLLPLSLTFDHRAIDGAGAMRFLNHLSRLLADARRLIL